MSYSRRNFLKAAGSGVVLTAVGGDAVFLAAAPLALAAPMTKEKAQFVINGKLHAAEYEARTTLWEVIAIQAGNDRNEPELQPGQLRGVQRVGGRDARLFLPHPWRLKRRARRFSPSKEWATQKNLHPLQRIGHMHVAADCGFCTAGWVVTAKGASGQESQSVRGRGESCAGRTYLPMRGVSGDHPDGDGFGRGSARRQDRHRSHAGIRLFRSRCPWCGIIPPAAATLPGDEVLEGAEKTVTKKWQGYPPENLNVLGKPMPALP